MKIGKKTLILLMTVGMISLVGCSSTNDDEVGLTQENIGSEVMNEEVQESMETEPQRITEEEALKIAQDGVKTIEPNAKLRVKGFDENGINGSYIIEYDVPFATNVTFAVDSIDRELTVRYGDYKETTLDKVESQINKNKTGEPLSYEEATRLFKKRMMDIAEMEAPILSVNQLDNLELACDYMFDLNTNYAWVVRYPMEKKQQAFGEFTFDNALDMNDKYGYMYIDPYEKTYATSITVERWENLSWDTE